MNALTYVAYLRGLLKTSENQGKHKNENENERNRKNSHKLDVFTLFFYDK